MIETVLACAKTEMTNIDLPYDFMIWKKKTVPDRYWIGEYTEVPSLTEDGYKEYTLHLTGTTKGTWLSLLDDKKKIEEHFPDIGGLRIATTDGVVVFYYENSNTIPTGDANLKRIQVDLKVKTWKGTK